MFESVRFVWGSFFWSSGLLVSETATTIGEIVDMGEAIDEMVGMGDNAALLYLTLTVGPLEVSEF